MAQVPAKKMTKFPWTHQSTSLLIQLYSENIKNFMSTSKVQIKLWRRLVEIMKDPKEGLPQELRDNLTESVAQRKWICLRQRFKDCFYDPQLQPNFCYYKRMEKMFTEYAELQLNESRRLGNELNETTPDEVSAFVDNLLQNSSLEISVLRCASNDSKELPKKPSPRPSEASKIREYIAKLPKESVSVMQANLRLCPNTPFNRKYALSTIVNHKNSLITTFKRSQTSSTFEPKIKKPKELDEQSQEFTIIETLDESWDDYGVCKVEKFDDYAIEALDECEISGIHSQTPVIKVETKPVHLKKFFPKTTENSEAKRSDQQVLKRVIKKSLNTPKEVVTFERPIKQRNSSVFQSSLQVPDQSGSVYSVPSMPSINIVEVETLSTFSSSLSTPCANETFCAAPDTQIVPKKLEWHDSSSVAGQTVDDRNQPGWFKNFLVRYNSDMGQLNTKMDRINGKLDKILDQTSLSFSIKSKGST